jgi:replicative DNA helicase
MQESVQAEKAILGAILLDADAIYQCGELKAIDFSLSSHRTIFSAMSELSTGSRPVDLVTLADHLNGKLQSVGDVDYLASLLDGVPDRPHIEHYVSIVSAFSRRRRLLALCQSTMNDCEDHANSTEDCLSIALDRLLELAGTTSRKSAKIVDYSFDVYDRIKRAANTPLSDLPIGLPTGLKSIDHMTTGLRPGELWILASWTGEGKTVLATQIIVENVRRNSAVLWFTHEMNRRQVLLRMIPQITNGVVKGRHLRDPRNMMASHMAEFERTQSVIDAWPLWVNDAASMEIGHLVAHSMAMIKQHKIKLIAVDYLQLVKGRGDSRYDKVSDVSNSLRELAKNSGVPILAVSQMARPENRDKRQPRIFDLKESGSIEQDAHVIIMPYRPQDKDGHYSGEDLIVIGKQREGPTGVVQVRFDSLTLTFQPRGKEEYEQYGDSDSMF